MKIGEFILDYDKNKRMLFMKRTGLEWLNETLSQNDHMNWDNPWHRAAIINKQKEFQAEFPKLKLEINKELRKRLVVASTKIH